MDLGPQAIFIWASYAVFVAVLAALIGWLVLDGKRQASALAELEARGVKRRPSRPAEPGTKGTHAT